MPCLPAHDWPSPALSLHPRLPSRSEPRLARPRHACRVFAKPRVACPRVVSPCLACRVYAFRCPVKPCPTQPCLPSPALPFRALSRLACRVPNQTVAGASPPGLPRLPCLCKASRNEAMPCRTLPAVSVPCQSIPGPATPYLTSPAEPMRAPPCLTARCLPIRTVSWLSPPRRSSRRLAVPCLPYCYLNLRRLPATPARCIAAYPIQSSEHWR